MRPRSTSTDITDQTLAAPLRRQLSFFQVAAAGSDGGGGRGAQGQRSTAGRAARGGRSPVTRTTAGWWERRRLYRRVARAERDAVGEVHLAAAEIRARHARGRVERDETGVNGPDEDAPMARPSGLVGGVEPGRDAA